MKTSHSLVASLLALTAASVFAACSSVEPTPAQIGVDPESIDAGSDADSDACAPESPTELVKKACDDVGKECGTATITDRCGGVQNVACGSFGGGCDQTSTTKNFCNAATSKCECKDSRTDAEVVRAACTAGARNCGDPGAKDNCGVTRAGSCGICDAASGATCGAAGVCGCTNAAATGLAFLCENRCVRNCLESCETAPNTCGENNQCVSACSAATCAGRADVCTTFVNSVGRSLTCTALPDGGACAPFSAPCSATPNSQGQTLGQQCGLTRPRAKAVCVLGDAGPGECFYCGAPGTNGLPCGGGGTCIAASRACQ
jgi:hypothetical protein